MFLASTRAGWVPFILLLFTLVPLLVDGHFIVSYPQQREYDYHKQFQFPCGGAAPSANRSAWPTNGGALSLVPIHAFALMTVNIQIGNNIDENIDSNPYSVPMVPLFNQTGANSTFCIPKIKIPKKIAKQVADGVNATIQVIQMTATSAALYSCIDITFSPTEADRFGQPAIWNHICVNETGMGGHALGTTEPQNATTSKSAATSSMPLPSSSLVIVGAASVWLWVLCHVV